MDLSHIKKLAEAGFDEMVEMRRHLHQHPEISYQEFQTTDFIISKLQEWDIAVDRPLETGCVGVIDGGQTSERVIALRADIDALAIQEEGEAKSAFISRNEGVAHCCGHDMHMANLLGTAHILSQLRNQIEGTVLLIFQPGEEKLPGGGRLLCETGYLQDKGVDAIYGLHGNPNFAPGEVALRKGPLMARPDEFEIEITGKGGHAAAPHETIDPILLASEVVTQLQTIVSRSVNPTDPAVVTVGKIAGGTTYNIIPEKASLIGTVRTFSQENAMCIKQRIEHILRGVTSGAGARYTFSFNEGYPAVRNASWPTDNVIKTAGKICGKQNVQLLKDPIMAGEDFAFYQQEFPGVFFFLGSGSKGADSQWSWHHPKYNVDEACFKTGAALMTALAFQPIHS